ncbi:MAG: SLBB domain-containing protein, partial [Candidatus Cloacimonadaceae bacterium]|nr:SLBB domain-containing protein [Candidatus Cloacimonadaceae bacterium]
MKSNKLIAIILILSLLSPMFGFDLQLQSTLQPISVGVTGYVEQPGFYRLTVLDRLSDAIYMAKKEDQTIVAQEKVIKSVSHPQIEKTVEDSILIKQQALRSVKLIRGGTEQFFDLLSFYRNGDVSQNPLLRDGDVIVVNPITETVSISGQVFLPDDYEYRSQDTLSDVIKLSKGLKPGADLKNVKLYRYRSNMRDFDVQTLDLSTHKNNPSVLDIPLQAFDRIVIPQDSQHRRGWIVKITGHVQSPGEYLLDEKTTLYDALVLSGGPVASGDLNSAILVHRGLYEMEDPEFERLKLLNMGSMTPIEYNYLRSKMRQLRGKYAVNPAKTWESKGKEDNPILSDGAIIYVPEQFNMVWVSGQVRNPGLIPYVEGKNWRYYVKAAGGFTNNRKFNGARVIRHSSGNWVKPTNSLVVRSGDIIFITESTDRDIWLDIKDV